jgi:hypothetical protein
MRSSKLVLGTKEASCGPDIQTRSVVKTFTTVITTGPTPVTKLDSITIECFETVPHLCYTYTIVGPYVPSTSLPSPPLPPLSTSTSANVPTSNNPSSRPRLQSIKLLPPHRLRHPSRLHRHQDLHRIQTVIRPLLRPHTHYYNPRALANLHSRLSDQDCGHGDEFC